MYNKTDNKKEIIPEEEFMGMKWTKTCEKLERLKNSVIYSQRKNVHAEKQDEAI